MDEIFCIYYLNRNFLLFLNGLGPNIFLWNVQSMCKNLKEVTCSVFQMSKSNMNEDAAVYNFFDFNYIL